MSNGDARNDRANPIDGLTKLVEDLESDLHHARQYREGKGMIVPWHGRFAAAVPTVLKDLDRLAANLRAQLPITSASDHKDLVRRILDEAGRHDPDSETVRILLDAAEALEGGR